MDHFTETTETGYGTNIMNSLKGIIVGFIFILISIGLLWWNEGRSVDQANALNDMKDKVITLEDTKYNAQYNNKAILLQGIAKPLSKLEDVTFGLKSSGLVLHRIVEMYQWQETKESESEDKLGGGTETITTYDYNKVWSKSQIRSSSFRHKQNHKNPGMVYASRSFSTDASMGDYHLSKKIVNSFEASTQVDDLSILSKKIDGIINHDSYLYKGDDPSDPQIGDLKIRFTYAAAGEYTIVGKLQNKNIVSYRTDNGKNFLFTRSGIVSANQIFQEELDSNSLLAWLFRLVGLIVMFIGFTMILGPLSTIANVIPMIGSIVEGATGIIALIITLLLGSVVIGLAWLTSRPIMALAIIALGIIASVVISNMNNNNSSTST